MSDVTLLTVANPSQLRCSRHATRCWPGPPRGALSPMTGVSARLPADRNRLGRRGSGSVPHGLWWASLGGGGVSAGLRLLGRVRLRWRCRCACTGGHRSRGRSPFLRAKTSSRSGPRCRLRVRRRWSRWRRCGGRATPSSGRRAAAETLPARSQGADENGAPDSGRGPASCPAPPLAVTGDRRRGRPRTPPCDPDRCEGRLGRRRRPSGRTFASDPGGTRRRGPGKRGGRPPVITDDKLHPVLRTHLPGSSGVRHQRASGGGGRVPSTAATRRPW